METIKFLIIELAINIKYEISIFTIKINQNREVNILSFYKYSYGKKEEKGQ